MPSASLFRSAGVAVASFILIACSPVVNSATPSPLVRPAQPTATSAQLTATFGPPFATLTPPRPTATSDGLTQPERDATAHAVQTSAIAGAATYQAGYVATLVAEATSNAVQSSIRSAAFSATSRAREDATQLALPTLPPTPANDATRAAQATAVYWSDATAVAASRKPGPAPTFDTSYLRGNAELDFPLTFGELQRKLRADSYDWKVSVTETGCKRNLEKLTTSPGAIVATISCAGGSITAGDVVAEIVVQSPFGGTVKGLSVGSTRADVASFLRRYNPSQRFGVNPQLVADIPAGRDGGPAGQSLIVEFSQAYTDFGEPATYITLPDKRFCFPVGTICFH